MYIVFSGFDNDGLARGAESLVAIFADKQEAINSAFNEIHIKLMGWAQVYSVSAQDIVYEREKN